MSTKRKLDALDLSAQTAKLTSRGDTRKRPNTPQPHSTSVVTNTPFPRSPRVSAVQQQEQTMSVSQTSSVGRTSASRSVEDAVHDTITLPGVLWRVIDTWQFQRLRYLKQLGATFMVYPGAVHSRFEHSIGVAHLGMEVVKKLSFEQPELGLNQRDILCIGLAGLCHDLGHGPFSHLFDAEFLRDQDWCHEEGSVRVLDYLLTDNGIDLQAESGLSETDIEFVRELILGKHLKGGLESRRGRSGMKYFLYEIINNERSGFDVDKLDYLLRDPYHAGVKRSNFSVANIFSQARVRKDENNITTISFPEKQIGDVLNVFKVRRELHRLIYQEESVKAHELMIRDILRLANPFLFFKSKHGPNYELTKMSNSIHDMSVFCQLKDSVLDLIEQSIDPRMKPAQDLIRRLNTRQAYKAISQKTPLSRAPVSTHGGRSNPSLRPISKSEKQTQEQEIKKQLLQVSETKGLGLTEEDFLIEVMFIDYGQGGKNPMGQIYFYPKYEIAGIECQIISEEKYFSEIPSEWQSTYARCFSKTTKEKKLASLNSCWKEYHKDKGCATPIMLSQAQSTAGDYTTDDTPDITIDTILEEE